MSVDQNKFLFSSNWTIDQIIASGTKIVNTPVFDYDHPENSIVTLYDFSALSLPTPPQFFVAWRRVNKTRWNMLGAASGLEDASFLDDAFFRAFPVYVQGNVLYAQPESYAAASLEFRYIIYKDSAVI